MGNSGRARQIASCGTQRKLSEAHRRTLSGFIARVGIGKACKRLRASHERLKNVESGSLMPPAAAERLEADLDEALREIEQGVAS